jgi:hypothetical protein
MRVMMRRKGKREGVDGGGGRGKGRRRVEI